MLCDSIPFDLVKPGIKAVGDVTRRRSGHQFALEVITWCRKKFGLGEKIYIYITFFTIMTLAIINGFTILTKPN